jgi:hypothetical protein
MEGFREITIFATQDRYPGRDAYQRSPEYEARVRTAIFASTLLVPVIIIIRCSTSSSGGTR